MKETSSLLYKNWITFLVALGLLLGAILAGLFAFNGSPAAAQEGTITAEHESDDVRDSDDANEGPDVPITGPALEQASAAALEYLGEGRVTETEVGDKEGFYEVEITRDNGRETDVHLDENFNVLGHEDD